MSGATEAAAAVQHAGNLCPAALCAVIVTFHPGPGVQEVIAAAQAQVPAVVLVDNGSTPEELKFLEPPGAAGRVVLHRNAENLGHAAALNQGCRLAARQGFTWVLLLDQDSVLAPRLVEGLCRAFAAYPAPERVALISANYWADQPPPLPGHSIRGTLAGYPPPPPAGSSAAGEEPWIPMVATLTSGTAARLQVIRELGGFAEELFIDFVDIEYCLRARRQGYAVLATRALLMGHAPGSPSRHRFLSRQPLTLNYGPIRLYYQYRNPIFVTRHYAWREPRYLAQMWWHKARCLVLIALFETQKTKKFRAVLRGLWHGLTRRCPGPRAMLARGGRSWDQQP